MLYFIVYLFLEVLISVNISSAIGGLATFFEIMLSAFVGISILVNFRATLMENMTAVVSGSINLEQFQKLNLFTLLGAVFLVIPGFMTDIFGLLLQFTVFTSMIVNRYNVKSGNYNPQFETNTHTKDSDVIDVEIIGDKPSLK